MCTTIDNRQLCAIIRFLQQSHCFMDRENSSGAAFNTDKTKT